MEKTKLHRLDRVVPDLSKGRCLDYGIADMCQVLLPDYALMDATVCMEGFGPSVGSQINLDVVAASKDPAAADYVAIALMGIKQEDVSHVNLARERCNLTPCDSIEVEPSDYMKYGKVFATADMSKLSHDYPNIGVIEKGTCSACSATIMAFVKTHGKKFEPDYRFTLATGLDLEKEDVAAENMVLVGNCARKIAKEAGLGFCKGCPPVGSSILAFMRGQEEPVW